MSELIAALAGAVVGGLIAAVAAWSTTKAQWEREVRERRHERLEDEVEVLLGQLTAAWNSRSDLRTLVRLPQTAARRSNTLEARARKLSPHLNHLISSIDAEGSFLDSEDLLTPPWPIFSYMAVLDTWFEDPEAFEVAKPTLRECRQRLAEDPSGWPADIREDAPDAWDS